MQVYGSDKKSPEEETIGHPKNDAGIGNVRN